MKYSVFIAAASAVSSAAALQLAARQVRPPLVVVKRAITHPPAWAPPGQRLPRKPRLSDEMSHC
jgi:hypothetical protein